MKSMRTIIVVFVFVASIAAGGNASARVTNTAATTVQVKGGEFWFKLSTKTLAKPGKVTFVFKNAGHIGHDFAIAGKKTPVIDPGKTATLVATLKKGNYPYKCTVPGHAASGMKGVLTVH